MNRQLIASVKESFETRFGEAPLLIFSPGRINLIGEHTDYNEGFVFPAAIDKGIVLAIQKSEASCSNAYALDMEALHSFGLEGLEPLAEGGWQNYVLGVVAELQKLGHSIGNFNMVFAGDIPSGAGMSSSAALENSVVYGLNELFGLALSKNEMIFISQKAEHHFAGVKCGIMDQYASMFGVENNALLLDCRITKAQPFPIDFKEYGLLLINTNVKHDLSESAYNNRRKVCEEVADLLGVKALRDASLEDLEQVKDKISTEDFEKASYIIEENSRVALFAEAIQNEDLALLGELLYRSHDGLSDKYRVSCVELDYLVGVAKNQTAILGARMMGGGFGGCTINLILKSEINDFVEEISENYKNTFNKDCSVYQVALSAGTRIIK
ncbi:MAG: galactokinase [Flavicella sp.]